MKNFAQLLETLQQAEVEQQTLTKSLPQKDPDDDKTILESAEEGDDDLDDNGNPKNKDLDDAGKPKGPTVGENPMTKSLTLENGEVVEDASELLKSLQDTSLEHEEVLTKALPALIGMIQNQGKALQSQGEMIKSLQGRVVQLSGQGRGRKTQLVITEKPVAAEETLAKSQQDQLTPQEFMLKANSAYDKGTITGLQLTALDVSLRERKPLNEEVMRKVMSANS